MRMRLAGFSGAAALHRPPMLCAAAAITPTSLPAGLPVVSSFCNACDALAATIRRHPHLKPTPGLSQQQLSTLHQLHSLAEALFELFCVLTAAWPCNSQQEVVDENTGLLNPTLMPTVRPAVRLSLALLSAVGGPTTSSPAATDSPAPAAPAPAATAAEVDSLRAALHFGNNIANTLQHFSGDVSHTHADIDTFAHALLADTRSSGSIFQLLLAVLALTATKLYRAAAGPSVWGAGTPAEPYHLELLQAVGLAEPPEALLHSPHAIPHPYVDDVYNAGTWLVAVAATAPVQSLCPVLLGTCWLGWLNWLPCPHVPQHQLLPPDLQKQPNESARESRLPAT